MRSTGWLRGCVLVGVLISLPGCDEPGFSVTEIACGWPCAETPLGCARPWRKEIDRGAARKPAVVTAAAIGLVASQLAVDCDPRIGETLLTALSYYPREEPLVPLTDVIARIEACGQHGVAAGIAYRVAYDEGRYADALDQLQQAHSGGAPVCPTVRATIELVTPLFDVGMLGKCQRAIDFGLEALAGYADNDLRYRLMVSRVQLLASTGAIDEALALTDRLLPRAPEPLERAWLHSIRAELLYTRQGSRQAEAETWAAVAWSQLARPLGEPSDEPTTVLSSAFYKLASLLREQRRFDEAVHALDVPVSLTDKEPTADQLYSRALISRDRGELERAEGGLYAALSGGGEVGDGKPPTGDLVWGVPMELGRVRAMRGDAAGAEAALRQAIAAVEALRASVPDSEAAMIAAHRQPYEELLGVLVRAGRWQDALTVLARLDAGRLNSDVAAPSELAGRYASKEPGGSHWLSSWPSSVRAPASVDELLAAWRGRHLVAVFRAGDQLCRLEADVGGLRGQCMGPAAPIERAAQALREDPNDAAAARLVGDALIPPGADALDLLLVGPIARAPTAALRDARGLVVARRPLQRVLGLLDDERAPATAGAARVVGFAGQRGTAAAAEREAGEIAQQLAVVPALGAAATRDAIIGGAPSVLHFAGHAHLVDGVPELELADGNLAADTIAAQQRAPRLVVLASCDSAAAQDEGGWGSLAAAFLHAGSERVIASDRRVDDVEAQALMRAFYEAGGVDDPARALGISQAARAAGLAADARPPAATTWAAFTVIAAPPRPALPPTR